MSIIILAIEMYLTAMLGVSALAKIDAPEHFENTLYRHRLLPIASIRPVSRIFPWVELCVAVALVSGIIPIIATALALTLFVLFLIIETILVVTHRTTDCGCFGVAYQIKVDGASLVVSSILVFFAGVDLAGAFFVSPVALEIRAVVFALLVSAGAWLASKIYARRLFFRGLKQNQSGRG